MKSLTVNKLEVGMVVARDVITSKSQVLLKKGIELDDYYIKIFDRYGIEYVVKRLKTFQMKRKNRFDLILKIKKNKSFKM